MKKRISDFVMRNSVRPNENGWYNIGTNVDSYYIVLVLDS